MGMQSVSEQKVEVSTFQTFGIAGFHYIAKKYIHLTKGFTDTLVTWHDIELLAL